MTNIFDTHAHYSSRQFDADRDAVMRALGEGGVVGVLECATHSGDWLSCPEDSLYLYSQLSSAWQEPLSFDTVR